MTDLRDKEISPSPVKLENSLVRAEVHSLGAMVGPVRFRPQSGGPETEPFFSATWLSDRGPEHAALPALIRNLRSEWPCAPFGGPNPRTDLPREWQHDSTWRAPIDPFFHGYGSHHHWQLQAKGNECHASIEYPPKYPIERLERRIALRDQETALDFTFGVRARRACALPLALHPIFRLPKHASLQAELQFSENARVWTFPVEVEPGRSLLVPDQRDVGPHAIGCVDGVTRDLRRLPFDKPGEDLVLLTGTDGHITLLNHAEGYAVTISWDISALPSCLLWISGGGRLDYPWLGSVSALGIEPCAAPFDLGPAYSVNADTPLRRAGIRTEVALRAGETWQTGYAISFSSTENT
jgi:galactose mutarotase-like enzyme